MGSTIDPKRRPLLLIIKSRSFLLILLLQVCQVRSATNKNEFTAVLAPGRPPYFQCPVVLKGITSRYPVFTNPQCSQSFTFCLNRVAISGHCPWGLRFNPSILSCDGPIPDYCYVDESEIFAPRFIRDDPQYNACNNRPCNFYPNLDDDDEGRTYIFCQFGRPNLRYCPPGTAFCTRKRDCILKQDAVVLKPVEETEGTREAENPADGIGQMSDDESMSSGLANRGQVDPYGIHEPHAGVVIVQTPAGNLELPEDARWSHWYVCPPGEFIVSVNPKQMACMPIGPGRDPERTNRATIIPLSQKWGVTFHPVNCVKGKGGVMISFRLNKNSHLVEFQCSNDFTRSGATYCPATKAMCGFSYMHGNEKDVVNMRARCCPVEKPQFFPEEKLTFVSILDNSKGKSPADISFNSTCGIAIPVGTGTQIMREFYVSLGFTIDHVWDTIERDLQRNMRCEHENGKTSCYYPWGKYEVMNRVGRAVTGTITVPPRTKINLHQVYAQAGYFFVYTNLFIQRTYKANKELVEETPWYGTRPERPERPAIPVPVLAKNVSVEQVQERAGSVRDKNLCPFHNLPSSKLLKREDKSTTLLGNPEGKERNGKWSKFKNCSKNYFVDYLTLGKKGGVVQLEMGCRSLLPPKKAGKEKRSVGDDEEDAPPGRKGDKTSKRTAVKRLEFSTQGASKAPLQKDDSAACGTGVGIGFQVKSGSDGVEDLKLVCSCPSESKATSTKGGWSEPQVCGPLQALNGFSPKFGDKGLTDFKYRCVKIPPAASKCEPKFSTKLVATCKTSNGANSCIFKAPIGVTYNLDKPDNVATANLMESVGHSLDCAYSPLGKRFRKRQNNTWWKDDYWHPVHTITGQVFRVPSGTEAQIEQVIGRCGPYVVYTNHFSCGHEKAEFDIPLQPGPAKPTCWVKERRQNTGNDEPHIKTRIKLYATEDVGRNRSYYMQRPNTWAPTEDAVWLPWLQCNDALPNQFTYVAAIQKDGIVCQPVLGPGIDPNPKLITFHSHDVAGLKLSPIDCNQVGGGVIIGFKQEQFKPTDWYCSATRPRPTSREEWCPPKTAMCGYTAQYSPTLLKVETIRMKCCELEGPKWDTAHERLAHVYTFENHQRHVRRKFKFETGIDGAVVIGRDQPLANYWNNLGYGWDEVWSTVEDTIIYNTRCFDAKEECLYPWSNYRLQSRGMFFVQKKFVVPPSSISKLYQVYNQVGFFRVYVNRFIEYVNDTSTGAIYEEVRDIFLTEENKKEIQNSDIQGGREQWKVEEPVYAANISIKEYDLKKDGLFCTYHNMSGPQSTANNMNSGNWQKCEKSGFLNSAIFVKNKGKIEIGCRDVRTLTRSGKYITPEDHDPDLVSESSMSTKGGRESNKMGECVNGLVVGIQKVGLEHQFLCSCWEEDQRKNVIQIRDKQVCKPFHAIQGISPTYVTANTETILQSVEAFCAPVPNPALTCQPTILKDRVHVAKCVNPGDSPKDCVFEANVGVIYNLESTFNIQLANALESIGYTIPCVGETLSHNFHKKFRKAMWREPMWFPISERVGKLTNAQENSNTNVFQVVARCGPYIVYTNRFVLIPEGKVGRGEDWEEDALVEMDLPVFDIPEQEKCWQSPEYKSWIIYQEVEI